MLSSFISKKKAESFNKKGIDNASNTQHMDAIYYYNEAIRLDPKNAIYYYNRGISYHALKKGENACADYTKSIELSPSFFDAYNNRGIYYKEKGDSQKAIKDFSMAIEIKPDFAKAYFNRGNTYKGNKNKELCVADYRKAAELDSTYKYFLDQEEKDFVPPEAGEAKTETTAEIETNTNTGQGEEILISDDLPEIGSYDEDRDFVVLTKESIQQKKLIEKNPILAIAIYTDTLQRNSTDDKALLYRGLAHMHLRHYEKAIADFAKAIKSNSQLAEAYYNRGLANEKMKEYDKASSDFIKASILEPDFAINNCNALIQKNPGDAGVYNKRGNVYMQLNRYQEAIEDYSRAIVLNENEAFAYYNRGIALISTGHIIDAVKDWQKAKELGISKAQDLLDKYKAVIDRLNQDS